MDEPEESGTSPPVRGLIALLLVVALIGAVWLVMTRLSASGRMQDCLASGRTNCAPVAGQ
jgi:hypothetical protein